MLVNKLICVASADQTAQICYFIITPTREKIFSHHGKIV